MDNQGLWKRFKQTYFYDSETGLGLDISRINFPVGFITEMQPRLERAFRAMQLLEKGEIANPDEGRQVGHYWLRNASLAPTAEIRSSIEATVKEIRDFTSAVHSGAITGAQSAAFKNVLVIGIGGSALGPQFVAKALGTARDPMRVFFFDNTDPDGMDFVLQSIPDLARTLCIVISKSGGTKETRNGMLVAKRALEAAGCSYAKNFVAITCPGSELDKFALKEGWLKRFPMWDWVGGRTSELSAVGLLPAALQGIQIDKMLQGASDMDDLTRRPEPSANPAALLALMWHHAGQGRGAKDMVVLPYNDRIELFSRYLQQLVMESLGKEKDLDGKVVHQGIAVYGNKGSTDQHAYVQQLRDGINNFFAVFIEVLKDCSPKSISGSSGSSFSPSSFEVEPGVTCGDYLNGFYQGTRRALYESGRESITITIPEVNEYSVGGLIALFERAVGLYASLININAYHQPGVEAGKKAAAQVLELQNKILAHLAKGAAPQTADEVASALGVPDAAESVFLTLRHLAANGRIQSAAGSLPYETKYSRAM